MSRHVFIYTCHIGLPMQAEPQNMKRPEKCAKSSQPTKQSTKQIDCYIVQPGFCEHRFQTKGSKWLYKDYIRIQSSMYANPYSEPQSRVKIDNFCY